MGSNGADGPNPAIADIPEEQVGYIDSVHPTTDVHGILGAFQAESLLSNTLIVDGESNALRGGRGSDLVLGRDGDDSVDLARGRDVAIAGRGDDSVNGGHGGDLIAGGDGADLLIGGRGSDIIADGLGNDLARGGRGADLMIDGAGDDVSSGGRGSDIFVFTEASLLGAEADASNTFFGGRGNDTLILRVADASADLGRVDNAASVEFTALGVTAFGVENVVIVEGTALSGEDFFDAQFEEAALWNLI